MANRGGRGLGRGRGGGFNKDFGFQNRNAGQKVNRFTTHIGQFTSRNNDAAGSLMDAVAQEFEDMSVVESEIAEGSGLSLAPQDYHEEQAMDRVLVYRFYRVNFLNETDATAFVYQIFSWNTSRILTIKPRDSMVWDWESARGAPAYVFSTRKREPLIFCRPAAETSPNQYLFEMRDDEAHDRRDTTPPMQVRILSSQAFALTGKTISRTGLVSSTLHEERTLKDLCMQTIADSLMKSKTRTDRLFIPKWLKSRFATKPSSKVEKLCLPRDLKAELRDFVDHLSDRSSLDYATAKNFIESAGP